MTTGTEQLDWYALRVMSRAGKFERAVQEILISRGHKAHIKLERKFGKYVNGQRKEREFCAAPGYVFLGTTSSPWSHVHDCHLITSVVSVNNRPARIHGPDLAEFLDMAGDAAPEHFRYFREAPFNIGDMVRIEDPSFEGFELPVKDIQKHEAIFQLVMMGQQIEARFPIQNCFKVA